MKVLQVIDTLNIGGAERILVTISNLLHRNGIDITVLLLVDDGDLVADLDKGISILKLKRKKRFDFSKLKECAIYLRSFNIIHTHLKHNYRYIAIVKGLFRLKTPVIFHDHSHLLNVSKLSLKFFKDSFFKNILKPNYYIGVSKENYHWAINYLKIEKEKCFLLENIIEKQQITKTLIRREGIIIVSNISRIKNLEFAIELIQYLNENLTIYGQNYDEEYLNELKAKIKILNIECKVTFIHNCNNIQLELYKYKFALHTSLKETGPLVLIEYLAHGISFLAFSSGQVFNTLGEDLPEFFIDNFKLEEWIQKLENVKLIEFKRLNELYLKYFNPEEYIQKCIKIYQHILNS